MRPLETTPRCDVPQNLAQQNDRQSDRMEPGTLLVALVVLGVLALVFSGCGPTRATSSAAPLPQESPAEPVELATLMGDMQRHSAKLGFAIRGKNQPLAQFYLEELHEVLEELEAIDEHEGMPIGGPSKVILDPALAKLEMHLQPASWDNAWIAYEAAIEACNRCHLATEHGFIKVVPASGMPPFNQIFAASETAATKP